MGAALGVLGAALPAQASTFSLGDVTSPTPLPWSHSGLLGPFDDQLSFSVTADHPLVFSSFMSTGFARRSTILDMAGELLASDGSVLEAGDAQTVFAPVPEAQTWAMLLVGLLGVWWAAVRTPAAAATARPCCPRGR